MIEEEGGLEVVWARHAVLAGAVRTAVGAWGSAGGLALNVIDPDRLRDICLDQAGLTLGVGLGPFEGRAFRIGHMGHLNPPMVLGALGTVEAALTAMGASVGSSGVASAAASIGAAFVL